jgi:hypothetical protein
MSYAISGTDALKLVTECELDEKDPGALARRLMPFLLGGLRAPLAEPLAKPKKTRKAA